MPRPRGYKQRTDIVLDRLNQLYPVVQCALDHKNPYELLVATILSAQCTDVRVNIVTPAFFKKYSTVDKLAVAQQADVEKLIQSTGFFRNKAKNLIGMAQAVVARFDGDIPSAREDLVTLPGAGRKTANVIRAEAFGLPGLPVDTHVTRLSRRLKLTNETDAVKIEFDLMAIIPEDQWGDFSLRLIEHGRRICDAKKPRCDECVLNDICPSAFVVLTAKPSSL
ncbi:MAG TPA: endonuclease III [Acidimicrobiia bacterium]|nr:endonuclease III [Acidimicrobiia bacterium]